ncbi:MAG: type II toxin-antitoxin system PemK/MazF family toxin [Candidatus Sericytochromatia bacterium]
MPPSAITAGDVVMVALPSHLPPGHEQEGRRPAVVVGVPSEPLRFPVVYIVPLTSQVGAWAGKNPMMYPVLPPGTGGLPLASVALLDQMRGVDVRRVRDYLGTLRPDEYRPIGQGIQQTIAYAL